jgi:protoporphyrinogen oxidase
VAIRCAEGFVRAALIPADEPPANYEEMLRQSFGEGMCETFFLPYNRKMWKRPLVELAPSGFHWNIARPSVSEVLGGLAEPEESTATYNSAAWYPRPPPGAPTRGMECLTQALAARAYDVRLGHDVESINLAARVVTARHRGQEVRFRFRSCCSTLPLPRLVELCTDVPTELKRLTASLVSNRVLSVALNVRGPRPAGRRHWHYFSDESLIFTRLVHLDLFDPDLAPVFGWPMLAEVTQRAEDERPDEAKLVGRVVDDIVRAGQLPDGCRVADANVIPVEPAYVVFSRRSEPIVAEALLFFRTKGIEPLGRYGRWEYSSMGQVVRDSLTWARNLKAVPGARAEGRSRMATKRGRWAPR